MDSNISLSSILTPKHFLLFLRSVLTDRILPVLFFFRQAFGIQLWLSDLYDYICYQGNNFFRW